MTDRASEIKTWVSGLLSNVISIEKIQSDASARKYWRVSGDSMSYIVMDTEPGEELIRFVQIAELLSKAAAVPEIIHKKLEQGLLLLTDFGSQTFFGALQDANPSQIDELYTKAIVIITQIQKIPAPIQKMDETYISDRLDVFTTWYLKKHLNQEISHALRQELQELQELFSECFQTQPQVLVHLDYHCRNLMILSDGNIGVIDFQDAMQGPITYDLVSLLQDAYITWPRSQVEHWVSIFAESTGLEMGNKLLRDFDLVGLQRHLKNLGVFARLHYRDHKSHYLPHINTLLNYIISTCERYDELAGLLTFMQAHVLANNETIVKAD